MHRRSTAALAISLSLQILLPVSSVSAATPPFPDMKNSWYGYQEAVSYLKARDAIGGYPNGTFQPAATINRAEFLKLVFRSRTGAEPLSGDCFLDVPATAWFAPFVCAAQRRGVVEGNPAPGGRVFRPEQPVIFAEAIKMLLLAYEKQIDNPRVLPGQQWFEPYVQALDRLQVLSRHTYVPGDPLTRERAADLISRFLRREEEKTDLTRSPGCGKPTPEPLTTVRAGGADRAVSLTVPRSYKPEAASPLIIVFFGRTADYEQLKSYIGIEEQATDYLVAYPTQIRSPSGSFSWSPSGVSGTSVDLSYFDALVETIAGRYCIDMERIFVAGYSTGAWMANSVACLRGGVVRASGTVAGDSVAARCTGPSAGMIIHNPKDGLVPFSAAERTRDQRLQSNNCQQRAELVQPDALKCQLYEDCDGRNTVTWCPHELDKDPRGVFYPENWPAQAPAAIVKFFDTFR